VNVTYSLALTLDALAAGFSYGFDIMDATGLPSGTVYPLLRRLEREGMVVGKFESESVAHSAGRPARRHYKLTAAGRATRAKCRARFPALDAVRQRAAAPTPRPAR
jgi:DNA-binding PadR family transcriptional regulator